jgi:hypothetical protein
MGIQVFIPLKIEVALTIADGRLFCTQADLSDGLTSLQNAMFNRSEGEPVSAHAIGSTMDTYRNNCSTAFNFHGIDIYTFCKMMESFVCVEDRVESLSFLQKLSASDVMFGDLCYYPRHITVGVWQLI